jgi:hypothetical protein
MALQAQVKLDRIQAKLHAAITHNPPERCLLTVEEAQASLEVVEHQLAAQAPAPAAK